MAEIWEIDELGFITNNKVLFHIGEVQGLEKPDDNSINVHFFARIITLTFENSEDQLGIYNWFAKTMKSYKKSLMEYGELRDKISRASLEIQNRMAGKFINDCEHT